MPEETKAQKLAAARKKLKDFQNRAAQAATTTTTAAGNADVALKATDAAAITAVEQSQHQQKIQQQAHATSAVDMTTNASTTNLSEKIDSELNLNGHHGLTATPGEGNATTSEYFTQQATTTMPVATAPVNEMPAATQMPSVANYFNMPATVATATAATPNAAAIFDAFNVATNSPPQPTTTIAANSDFSAVAPAQEVDTAPQLNAIQILITEKAQLTSELNKYRIACHEKDFELEEARTQYRSAAQRLEDLHGRIVAQEQSKEQLRNVNAELQHKLAQASAKNEDQESHLAELRKQLAMVQARSTELEQQLKDKSNELEMSQLRVRQLSDEANVSSDNRVETLTQTQFMYEQQIRDLQAMVQQLTQDKEQANLQYQNYAQHLNSEVANLTERNAELIEKCSKLEERESQLVDHISTLEREIQKNISRQDQYREDNKPNATTTTTTTSGTETTSAELQKELDSLKERVSEFDMERHEFQLKIKSQEDRLQKLNADLLQRDEELTQLRTQLEHVASEQPDKTRLLATMESDKVAASRALTQNVELKKQLDELEMRFVQLTNDKADLMNRLDAEVFNNRDMRTNYANLQENLKQLQERFQLKDEEMIRLSHENMQLTSKNALLLKQIRRKVSSHGQSDRNIRNKSQAEHEHDDHGHPHEANDHENYKPQTSEQHENMQGDHAHSHNHADHENHAHDHSNHSHDHTDHHDEHDHPHDENDHSNDHQYNEHEHHSHDNGDHHHHHQCEKSIEPCFEASENFQNEEEHELMNDYDENEEQLPMDYATQKLEQRFTALMVQLADVTDEKQRLEHLCMQLQGETETIGEYIALYQRQRRMLKQREYEKAAQMQLLQEEREQLREKITILNNLVQSLGVELPQSHNGHALTAAALAQSVSIEPTQEGTAQTQSNLQQEQHQLQQQQQQQHDLQTETALNEKLNSLESQQILTKIQSIISEIKENTREVPTVHNTVDHLNCCSGKFEVV